jgi:hypothetical protein
MRKPFVIFGALFVLISLGWVACPVQAQNTLYVSPAGSGTACTTSSPCSLQYAVEIKATSGAFVYLQSGTYTASDLSDPQVVHIDKDMTLTGRCLWGGGSVDCGLHNPETILDGQDARRVITIQGTSPDRILISLSHLRITNGNADMINTTACAPPYGGVVVGCGGGIFAQYADSLTIAETIFWGNRAASHSVPNAVSLGGALYMGDSGTLSVNNAVFTINEAADTWSGVGGALYAGDLSGNVSISNTYFLGNIASRGTAIGSYGPAIALYRPSGSNFISDNFFENNGVIAISAKGAALYADEPGGVQFADNTIISNYGNSMIEIHDDNASPDILLLNNYLWANQSAWANVWLEETFSLVAVNNIVGVQHPPRENRGGATYNLYLYGHGPGQSTADVFHNTLAAADAGVMSAGYVTASVKNNIISHQDIIGIGEEALTPNVIYDIDSNLFFSNTDDGYCGVTWYKGDPHYTAISLGDLHINPGSAALDRGKPLFVNVDYEGDPRPVGLGSSPYDLGADELVFFFHLPLALR